MEIRNVKLADIKPYERNAKKHPRRQVEQISKSLERYGWKQPLVISADGVIVIGHGRYEAAKLLELDSAPCVVADDLTAEEIKELRLADNKLNESEWDFELLELELGGLDFGDLKLDWGINRVDFENHMQAARENGERDEDYEAFEEKFKPKLTTDDCYTPPLVYEAVKEWAVNEYGWQGRKIIRPFYPGGDYQDLSQYPENCVVIDNPPFSIYAEIRRFYNEHGIDYFLFAPHMTLFSSIEYGCFLGVGAKITYENGAVVPTSFVSSQGDRLRTAPDLYQKVQAAVEETNKESKVELPYYTYPVNLITASKLSQWSALGIDYKENSLAFIHELDAQKKEGKTVYGGGFLVPVAEAAKAAKAAKAEREKKAIVWEFSEREKAIIRELEAKANGE